MHYALRGVGSRTDKRVCFALADDQKDRQSDPSGHPSAAKRISLQTAQGAESLRQKKEEHERSSFLISLYL